MGLLQMLDAGRIITLADHWAYDLSGLYIVYTSNIGSQPFCIPHGFRSLRRSAL